MSDELIPSIAQLRKSLARARRAERTVGLAPTMGALHQGHARLIEQAVMECDCVVVSIFVNPIQFDRQEDLNRYPKTLEADIAFCDARGVQIVFAPPSEEMYPGALRTYVNVTRLTDHLCGPFRPGHFRGVATVVAKLFNIVQPDRAYFGEKDAQQLAVIRRMVRDLDMPVTIVEVPTVRESDGLAASSRNALLSAEQRRIAPVLYRTLQCAAREIEEGAREPGEVQARALAALAQVPEVRVEYFEIVDTEEMQPVERIDQPVRVAAAIWLGSTRLIDNILAKSGSRVVADL